jgi:benzoate membrane transport protein
MISEKKNNGEWIAPVMASLPITVMRIASISLILAASRSLSMTHEQMTSWLTISFLICGIGGLFFSVIFRQPLAIGFSNANFVFLATVAGFYSLADLQGALFISGIVLALIGLFNLSSFISNLIPEAIIKATLVGALIPFISEIFNQIGIAPLVVGTAFLVFVLSSRFLSKKIPALLPTIVIGLVVAIYTGQFSYAAVEWIPPHLIFTRPTFSFGAILTISPVIIILSTLQGNIPSITYIRQQGFTPPARWIDSDNACAGCIDAADAS